MPWKPGCSLLPSVFYFTLPAVVILLLVLITQSCFTDFWLNEGIIVWTIMSIFTSKLWHKILNCSSAVVLIYLQFGVTINALKRVGVLCCVSYISQLHCRNPSAYKEINQCFRNFSQQIILEDQGPKMLSKQCDFWCSIDPDSHDTWFIK